MQAANATVYRIPGDDTTRTRRLGIAMVYFARLAAHDPEFVWWARAAVRDIPSKAHRMIARRLMEWERMVVRYRYDPMGLEWQQDPRHTLLTDGAGDCNNMVALLAGLGLAVGYDSVIRFAKCDQKRRDEFSHVWNRIGVPDGQGGEEWIAQDPTQAHAEPGWEPPCWEIMDFDVAAWSPSSPEDQAWWDEIDRLAKAGRKVLT